MFFFATHQVQNLREAEVVRGEHVLERLAVGADLAAVDQPLLRGDRVGLDGVANALLELCDLRRQWQVLGMPGVCDNRGLVVFGYSAV